MTIFRPSCVVAICAVMAAMAQQVPGGAQASKFDEPQIPQSLNRFEGKMSIRIGGRAVMVDVTLKDWVVRNRQNIQLPQKGLLFVEMLSGGTATVNVGNRQVTYKDGDHFSVPDGASLQVATENDTVILRVLSLVP